MSPSPLADLIKADNGLRFARGWMYVATGRRHAFLRHIF